MKKTDLKKALLPIVFLLCLTLITSPVLATMIHASANFSGALTGPTEYPDPPDGIWPPYLVVSAGKRGVKGFGGNYFYLTFADEDSGYVGGEVGAWDSVVGETTDASMEIGFVGMGYSKKEGGMRFNFRWWYEDTKYQLVSVGPTGDLDLTMEPFSYEVNFSGDEFQLIKTEPGKGRGRSGKEIEVVLWEGYLTFTVTGSEL
jgi:hypothetical protein